MFCFNLNLMINSRRGLKKMKTFGISQSHDYDVLVVGGGTTGIAAAIASARAGARTLIIDCLGFLGGNSVAIPAWLGFHDLEGNQVVGGIAAEMIKKMQFDQGATNTYLDPICGCVVGIDMNHWKLFAMSEVGREGVDVLLHSLVVDADMDGDLIRGVYCQTRGGLMHLKARTVVDCTDAGDIARFAGAQLRRGRQSDGKMQVASWVFGLGNVKFYTLMKYFRNNPEEIRPFPGIDYEQLLYQMSEAEVFVMGSFRNLIERARNDGLEITRENFPGVAFPKKGEIYTVATRLEDVDPLDPWKMTHAEVEGMRQVETWMSFLQKYAPGFRNCRLIWTPHQIGMRETYHLTGDYLLTGEDLVAGRRFEDGIARGGYHIDVHSPDHGGLDTRRPKPYSIPYRSLLAKGVDGLLVAGRAISATHEAMASTRVIPIGMAMGQAAGVAAAMSVKDGNVPRELSIEKLQSYLRGAHAIVD